MAKQHVTISDQDGVVRIDKFLANKFTEYSRAAITKLFDLNLIKRDGTPLKPGEKVRPGTKIEYDLGPLQEVPEVIQLPIIYEDDDVVVVDKPAGIISHARGRFWQEASVASFIRDKVSQQSRKSKAEGQATKNSKLETQNTQGDRAGIVHRLDRATSGVMICAKHEQALKTLQKQFHDRQVKKTYQAVIKGELDPKKAKIVAPIGRNLDNPKQFHVTTLGKQAETLYEVTDEGKVYSLVQLTPYTGRTHQLRVHLDYIGHPIVGDMLYGGADATRLMLHAHSLEIRLPSGDVKKFISELPAIFMELVDSDE